MPFGSIPSMSMQSAGHRPGGLDRADVRVPRRWRGPGAVWLCFAAALPLARADYYEPFESAAPTWRLADADCAARLQAHERTFQIAHSGHACEYVRVAAGQGTYVHLVQPVPRNHVIAEWQPTVWVRSDRPGLQFMARVVLPRSREPRTGGPLTTLLRGDIYQRVGQWQQLGIHQPEQLLERQVRVLRSQFGPQVDAREAYVDLVVLNAYGGVGVTNIWIDDLQITGYVPITRLATHGGRRPSAPGGGAVPSAAPSQGPAPRVQVSGSVLLVDGRPLFPRAIEYNGESFEWLKSLGFNAVKLDAAPSGIELREAERLGLWLIAPPPNDGFITPSHDRVLAWDLGTHLTADRLELTRQRIGQLRRSELRPERPLVADAAERVWSYSRMLDFLVLRRSVIASALPLAAYGRWIAQRPALARPGTPIWATIQTEPPIQLIDQWAALGLGPPASMAVEPEQIRLVCYQAIASGARGLVFASRSPLDRQDADTQRRVRALKRINLELDVIEPWAAGGTRSDDVECGRTDVRIGALQTERSQLLIILHQTHGQQFTAAPSGSAPLAFVVPNTASSPQIFRLTSTGLEPLAGRRVAGGVRVALEHAGRVSLVAVTQDELAISHLTRSLAERRVDLATLEYEIASAELKLVESVHVQLAGQSSQAPTADRWLQQARSNLRHCELLLGADDHAAASRFSDRALDGLAQARRIHWEEATRGFPSPVASPYCVLFASLPLHKEMARRLQGAPQWSDNLLPAGDFESLEHIRTSGWQNISPGGPKLRASVELSPEAPVSGNSALRLAAVPTDAGELPIAVESPPVRIISAPVQVRRGQLVRLHGWVRVPEPIAGSQDGLMVYDSFGGPALAERITATSGWREFTLYRAAPYDGNVTITFALTGVGQAWVDDVTIALHDPIGTGALAGATGEARRLPPAAPTHQ